MVVMVVGALLLAAGGWAWLVERGNRKTTTPVVASASTATPATIGSSRPRGALCRGWIGGGYGVGWGIVGGSGWDDGSGCDCCCGCGCCATGAPHDPQNRA
jgi:hypothetical protein